MRVSLRVQVPNHKVSTQNHEITIPKMETLNALWLATLDPLGFGGRPHSSSTAASPMLGASDGQTGQGSPLPYSHPGVDRILAI